MGWYRADTSRARHPKIRQLARSLGIHRLHAVGIHDVLCSVPTDTMQIDGYLGRLDPVDFAEDCDWDGDPAVLWSALEAVGLVDVRRGGRRYVHDYQEWAGSTKEAVRKAKYRERASAVEAPNVPGQSLHTDGRTDVRTNERTDGREEPPEPADLIPDPVVMTFRAQGKGGQWALTAGHLASLERDYFGLHVKAFLEHMRGKAERGALKRIPKDYTKAIENWCSSEANDPRSRFAKDPSASAPQGPADGGTALLSPRGQRTARNMGAAIERIERAGRSPA